MELSGEKENTDVREFFRKKEISVEKLRNGSEEISRNFTKEKSRSVTEEKLRNENRVLKVYQRKGKATSSSSWIPGYFGTKIMVNRFEKGKDFNKSAEIAASSFSSGFPFSSSSTGEKENSHSQKTLFSCVEAELDSNLVGFEDKLGVFEDLNMLEGQIGREDETDLSETESEEVEDDVSTIREDELYEIGDLFEETYELNENGMQLLITRGSKSSNSIEHSKNSNFPTKIKSKRYEANSKGKGTKCNNRECPDEQSKSEESPVKRNNEDNSLQKNLRNHPLFFGITMGLLAEIINSRLFTTVRDSLGLTYDVSFELSLFDRIKLGWYVISVTSTPGKVYDAVDACKKVLRGLHNNKIVQRELDRAKRTLLMRHEAEIKSNAYWLGLLAHLQAESVPRKDISCIKDLVSLYEAATIEDIYSAYQQLKVDEESLYSCIGIAGAQAQAGEEISEGGLEGGILPVGRGLSTMTRPTT